MKQLQKIQHGFRRTKLVLCALFVLLYVALICLSGGKMPQFALVTGCALLYIYFPGRCLSWLLRLDAKIPEAKPAMGILLGTGFFVALYCVTMRLGILLLLRILPPLFAFVWLAIRVATEKDLLGTVRAAMQDGNFLCRLVIWAGLVCLFAFCISIKNAHPSIVGRIALNQDLLWNAGNAESFTIAFPPQDIRFSMVRLSYHYLTEMTEGALSIVSGVSAYDIIAFYFAPCVLGALVTVLWNLGLSFYEGNQNKALLLVFAVFGFNCASGIFALTNGQGVFFNTNLYHIITNINSQATALIFAGIFFILFAHFTRKHFAVGFVEMVAFLGSFVLLCFAKGPAAAIVVCSFAITMIFVLLRKPKIGRALLCFAGVICIFAVVYFVIFASGANTSVHFGFNTLQSSVFGPLLETVRTQAHWLYGVMLVMSAVVLTFCMAPWQMFCIVGGLLRDMKNILHLRAEKMLAYGITAGGFLAYYLFWHPSYSQLYFVLIALFTSTLLAVDTVGGTQKKTVHIGRICCGALGVFTTVILCINFVGSGMRQFARNYDIIPKYIYNMMVSAADEEAMDWLRANTVKETQFITNRIDTNNEDGISNVYSAFSGRQSFMEGYTYAVTNMGVSEAVVNEKKAVYNIVFSSATSGEKLLQTMRENHIDYIVYCVYGAGERPTSNGLQVLFENGEVTIYGISGL